MKYLMIIIAMVAFTLGTSTDSFAQTKDQSKTETTKVSGKKDDVKGKLHDKKDRATHVGVPVIKETETTPNPNGSREATTTDDSSAPSFTDRVKKMEARKTKAELKAIKKAEKKAKKKATPAID